MLVSTRILLQFSNKTSVAREWRVVTVPSEDTEVDIRTFFQRIIDHVYDPLEPFQPTPRDRSSPLRASVGATQKGDFQEIPLIASLEEVTRTFGIYLKFFIVHEDQADDSSTVRTSRNAFEVLMASSRNHSCLPAPPSDRAMERSKKFTLKNDILRWLQSKQLGWSPDEANSVGNQFVTAFTDILWYIDGHVPTFIARACSIPEEFQQFSGYNEPTRSKHRKRETDNLSAQMLDSHSTVLNGFLLHPWLNSAPWKHMKTSLTTLADSLHKYADYLHHKNQEVQENHLMPTPVRSRSQAESFLFIKKSTWVKPELATRYQSLQSALDSEDVFVPIFLNDYAPSNQRQRRYYIDTLKTGQCLTCDCVLYDHATGNCLGTIHFIWKASSSTDPTVLVSGNATCIRKIEPSLPVYHTRAMKKLFFDQISLLRCGKPSALRGIYRLLTGDMSSSENLCEAQVDERIDAIINTQDPSIVDDLRHHNRGHPTMYEYFWEQCKKFLEDETAADDRRHDEHTHLAKAISVRDLLEQVAQRCPDGCPIPSKQWLRLQFWPKNQTNKTALQYTGRLDVKFMIQVRQLRKSHEDSHYCAAMFKYLKEFVVRFREHAALLCLDDKHRCKVGEPGLPVAAVERGKSVVVTTGGKRFLVADHDFTKFSIIPSVVLLCDIPDDPEKSFYRGQVYVGIKDSALEPSSALRHSTELSKLLLQNQISSPILVLFTDGGPDHNNTFLSVKLGLIALFLQLDLDMLEAVRTAPYQSWKNPCERVHSVLNLGLQATGLMRTAMEQRFESAISKCNSVKDVRDAVKQTPDLEEALKDSVEPVKTLLHSVFSRLNLKEKPISSFVSASQHEMDAFFSALQDIEPEITQNDRSANVLPKRPALSAFMKHCCYERKYLFGIKKCGKLDCQMCKAPRLAEDVFKDLHHIPDPVPDTSLKYKSFDELYGTITTEQYRPSKSKTTASTHGIPFSPNAQTARELVCCSECLKPRVIYAQRKLTFVESSVLSRSLEGLLYSCGSTLKGIEVECRDGEDSSLSTLFERLFVRQNLSCDDSVEVPYYSSDRFEDVCVHCGCMCAESQSGQYPICNHCRHEGKHPVWKRKRKIVEKE